MHSTACNVNVTDLDHLVNQIKKNDCFRDFFNKFCCLPIFGQRVAFRQSGKHILLDPSLKDQTERLSDRSQDYILRWFLSQRFELFNKSRIGCEFKLFLSLRKFEFTGEHLYIKLYTLINVNDLPIHCFISLYLSFVFDCNYSSRTKNTEVF